MPLADKLRPQLLDDICGQEHIIGKGRLLNSMIERGFTPNMIFYGPPGIGKTTTAEIIAANTKKAFYKLNATTASTADIKSIISELDTFGAKDGVLLYIDEIQSFNKRQQQSVLEFIEDGSITLIAATTENPYHYVYKALLSRSTVLEFKPLTHKDILKGLRRALERMSEESFLERKFTDDGLIRISHMANGDMRGALNILELAYYSAPQNVVEITDKEIADLPISNVLNFDVSDDVHYDLLSAFQKSIRGSDPNAALHYLARLIKGGDLISIVRRLLVIASEDVGLAYPNAASICNSLCDSAMRLGLPEARIPLSQAVILLATSPKSNAAYTAINEAIADLDRVNITDIPSFLRDSHYSGAHDLGRGIGYKYPHDYPDHYCLQDYMPKELKGREYYIPQGNKFEQGIKKHMDTIRERAKEREK